jgi:hypothetical protein
MQELNSLMLVCTRCTLSENEAEYLAKLLGGWYAKETLK